MRLLITPFQQSFRWWTKIDNRWILWTISDMWERFRSSKWHQISWTQRIRNSSQRTEWKRERKWRVKEIKRRSQKNFSSRSISLILFLGSHDLAISNWEGHFSYAKSLPVRFVTENQPFIRRKVISGFESRIDIWQKKLNLCETISR